MGQTKLQIVFNPTRMIDLAKIKKARGVPVTPDSPGFLSDDTFARVLLLEKIDEELKKIRGN